MCVLYIGGELRMKDKNGEVFITRYGQNIQSAQYFYNKANLLIATRDNIRICDSDAENCHIITTKDADTLIAHPAKSKKIIFVQNGILKQVTLNGPSDNNYLEISL